MHSRGDQWWRTGSATFRYVVTLMGLVWLTLVSLAMGASACEADAGCNYDTPSRELRHDGTVAVTPITSVIDDSDATRCGYDDRSRSVRPNAHSLGYRSAPEARGAVRPTPRAHPRGTRPAMLPSATTDATD